MIPPFTIEYGGRSWTLVADGGRWRIGEIPRAEWRADRDAAERYLKRLVDSGEALTLLEEADEVTTRAVACDQCRDAPPMMRAPTGRGLWCAACVEKYNDKRMLRQEDTMDRSEEIRAHFVGIKERVADRPRAAYTPEWQAAVCDAYRHGHTSVEISRALDKSSSVISRALATDPTLVIRGAGATPAKPQEEADAPAPVIEEADDASETTCTECGTACVDYRQEGERRWCVGCAWDAGRDALPPVRVELLVARAEQARRQIAELKALAEDLHSQRSEWERRAIAAEQRLDEWRRKAEAALTRCAALEQRGHDATIPEDAPLALEIRRECSDLAAMLVAKNRAYGNSAIDPVRVFSTASPTEQIRVRLDDKLSRLQRGRAAGEDVILDLLGYLILLRIAERRCHELGMEV